MVLYTTQIASLDPSQRRWLQTLQQENHATSQTIISTFSTADQNYALGNWSFNESIRIANGPLCQVFGDSWHIREAT